MDVKEKICVALDVDSGDEAIIISHKLKGLVGLLKVGAHLFTIEGPNIIKKLRSSGIKIFLDLKYHDIPNTTKNTARATVRLGISIFNVHITGGYEMMEATSAAIRDEALRLGVPKPLVLGVTVLTSINQKILSEELLIKQELKQYVVHLAKLAQSAGLDGVVASPLEIESIRAACGPHFKILTPGVRPSWAASSEDQKRILTPKEAINNGADYIVIGRPIIKAADPVEAAKKIIEELSN